MVHFQDLFEDINNMFSHFEDNEEEVEADQIPPKLVQAWTAATKLRVWKTECIEENERKNQTQFEEDFKKEWAEEHPSQPALEGKLSEEHQAIVDERVKK